MPVPGIFPGGVGMTLGCLGHRGGILHGGSTITGPPFKYLSDLMLVVFGRGIIDYYIYKYHRPYWGMNDT